MDTYAAESRTNTDPVVREQWLTTIRRQLEEVAARIESDAIVLTDIRHRTLAVAGRLADRWPLDRDVIVAGNAERDRVDVITHMNGTAFRVVSVPFDLDGVRIGALYLATAMDHRYAEDLARAGRRAHRHRQRRPDRRQHPAARRRPGRSSQPWLSATSIEELSRSTASRTPSAAWST